MYIIAGLGNPTQQYEHTRHNIGFDTITYLADRYHIPMNTKNFRPSAAAASSRDRRFS